LKIKLLFCVLYFPFVFFSQRNLDSIAKANVKAIYCLQNYQRYISTDPNLKFKVTFSANINSNISFSTLGKLTLQEYLSLGAYDVRFRYYITPNLKVFQRMLITGVDQTNYFSTTGIIIKF